MVSATPKGVGRNHRDNPTAPPATHVAVVSRAQRGISQAALTGAQRRRTFRPPHRQRTLQLCRGLSRTPSSHAALADVGTTCPDRPAGGTSASLGQQLV